MSALDLLRPFIAAFLVSGAVLAVAAVLRLWAPETVRRIGAWGAPAAGYLAGAWFVRGIPGFPPSEVGAWVFWGVAAAGLLGLALSRHLPKWLVWIGRAIVAGGLVFVMVRPLIGRTWEGNAAVVWPVVLGAAWLAVWALLVRGRKIEPAWKYSLLLSLSAGGLSVLLMVGGVASYSQYALALTGAIVGVGAGSLPLLVRFAPEGRAAAALVCVAWSGLLTGGLLFAEVPPASAALAAAALLGYLFSIFPKVKRLGTASMACVQVGWIVLCFAASIVWAYHSVPRFDY